MTSLSLFIITMCLATLNNNGYGKPIQCITRPRFSPYYQRGISSENLVSPIQVQVSTGRRNAKPSQTGVNKCNLQYVSSQKTADFCNAISINARSLHKNLQNIKQYLSEFQTDIATFTETWLKSDDIYEQYELCGDGYSFFRFDRPNQTGGGVAIMCRNDFQPLKIETAQYKTFEHVMISLKSSSKSLRLACIYRPPKSNYIDFLSEFSEFLEDYSLGGSDLIITGDFNVHWDSLSNSFTKKFRQILEAFGFDQTVSKMTHKSGHILDLVLAQTNNSTMVKDTFTGDRLTDHNAVHFTLSFPKKEQKSCDISYRKLKNIDIDKFKSDIQNSELSKNYQSLDLESLVNEYDITLKNILEDHAPLIVRKRAGLAKEPWYDDRVKKARRKLRSKERKLMKHNTPENELNFREEFDRFNLTLEKAQSEYFSSLISENDNNQSCLFKKLNRIMRRNKNNPLPEHLKPDDLANTFNKYFTDKIDTIRDSFNQNSADAHEFDQSPGPGVKFTEFKELTISDVIKMINMAANKSCDLDPIPTKILKSCANELAPIICRIINLSLTNGTFPEKYKTALVTPLLKKESLDRIPKNYRPVSNLGFVSKLIEQAVIEQVSVHLQVHDLLEDHQSAYRACHSTETALLKVFSDIYEGLDNRQIVLVSLLDLSAAFDTIDHDIFLKRLENCFGIGGRAQLWYKSYLDNRGVRVKIGNALSERHTLKCSAPQGSKIGPRIYNDYTKPLGSVFRNLAVNHLSYADDSQLNVSASPKSPDEQVKACTHLARSIDSTSDWMRKNRLKINPDKTEFLVISNPCYKKDIVINDLVLKDTTVKRSGKARNLGVILDDHVDLEAHISDLCRRCYFYIRWIRSIRKFISEYEAKVLVHTLVISRLDYCNSLLFSIPKSQLSRLQSVMNSAARLIKLAPRDCNITPLLKELHWLPIESRIKFKILTLTFNALHDKAPQYIKDMLSWYSQPRLLRSANQMLLKIPRVNNKYGRRSFSFAAPTLWNALPRDIKNSACLPSFKRNLKTHLFRAAY